jgi:tripartite-type tricarboxylate transporter receptor subunit TctC
MRIVFLLLLSLISSVALGQGATAAYPSKAVRFVVPYPAGGGYDVIARVIGRRLQEDWGQPVVVENRVGGNGIIGTDFVAKSAPDGYTIMLGGIGPHAINPSLYANVPYNALTDFSPVILVSAAPNLLLVHPSIPVRTVPELVTYLKGRQGQVNYASTGSGSASHLATEMFNGMAGVKTTHIPYKGSAPAITALLGGQVEMGFLSIMDVLGHVRAGKMRVLATGGNRRAQSMPDVPTVAESGLPGFENWSWFGVLVPARTPHEIVGKLNADIGRIMEIPEIRKTLSQNGDINMLGGTPEQFAAYLKSEVQKWAKVIRDAGIKAD